MLYVILYLIVTLHNNVIGHLMKKILLYLFSRQYRKHRWAAKHLSEYRSQWLWRLWRRVARQERTLWKQVCQHYNKLPHNTIHIPEMQLLSSEDIKNEENTAKENIQ